ncbi:helix-turn-helix domain-containing protein [Magnetospirillum fulvum]|uniref:Prophage CP4-57 regulator n=1 Tax=Magnetospirillum fulvum MGU-K5 TaxID=1316936 RepID=S9TXZ4_MAGFU|nr:helix-turn-helix domain-containing protein [Magnetospirillum fulvum]EPY03230.1 prophage CP4-57 regulator [Magnetospirillum fulvum MGU-K5]
MINRITEPRPAPLAYSIRDALAAVGIGRSSLYSEIGAGRLKTFKIGSRTLIAAEDLESWLDSFRTPAALAAN